MSRAFVKELEDGVEELPERPISPHPNLVTAEGLAHIEAEVARLQQEHATAHAANDGTARRCAQRPEQGAFWLDRDHRPQRRAPPDFPDRRRGRGRPRARHALACLAVGARTVRERARGHGQGRAVGGGDRGDRLTPTGDEAIRGAAEMTIGEDNDRRMVSRARRPQGFADHALKSASDTLGSFLRKATIVQISRSGTSTRPKLGIPVMWMPCLTTQNKSCGLSWSTSSLRSGGSGRKPSENLAQFTPGAP